MAQDPCVGECVKAIRRCSDLSPDPEQIRRCHCVIGDCASTVPVSCLLEHIASAAFPSLMKMTILTPLDLNATPTVSLEAYSRIAQAPLKEVTFRKLQPHFFGIRGAELVPLQS